MHESISSEAPPREWQYLLARTPCGRIVGIAASLLTAAPAPALACPVCGFIGTSNNTWAYQAMSAMLTLLPLAMVGATVWWLSRLAARADAERSPARQPVVDHALLGGVETYSPDHPSAS